MFATGSHMAGMLAGSSFVPQQRLPAETWLPSAEHREAPTGLGSSCADTDALSIRSQGTSHSCLRDKTDGLETLMAGLTDRWNSEVGYSLIMVNVLQLL